MAKGKTTKKTTAKTAGSGAASKPVAKAPKASRSDKVQKVVEGAKKLAQNPATTEVVAATLVAAAAALRDPKKARALAAEAADDLRTAAKTGVEGGILWQLALDVARRSIDEIGAGNGGKGKKKAKKGGAKKKK